MEKHITTSRFVENSGWMNAIPQQQPLLLLVNNNDGMLEYLAEELKSEFRVIKSTEAINAYQMAQLHQPDIIVADTLFPDGNGYDLCMWTQQNASTATIPFVFIAAFTGQDFEMKGLQMGAMDVMHVSVNPVILRLRLRNIVQMNLRMRRKIQSETMPDATAAKTMVSSDDIFLEKVLKIIDKHLDNPELGVALLCSEAGLSSNNLYRRIKSLTNLSIPEFIRQRRIKLSAMLLGKHNHFVQEVCYMVGFNSPSYFSRCFREQFGCSPKEYTQKQTAHHRKHIALNLHGPLQVVNW